jgi:hypothetical protein
MGGGRAAFIEQWWIELRMRMLMMPAMLCERVIMKQKYNSNRSELSCLLFRCSRFECGSAIVRPHAFYLGRFKSSMGFKSV